MLATELAAALDPVVLARRAGIEPDPWAARLLRSQARQAIVVASRQIGKTTCAGVLSLHTALYQVPSTTLIVSPTLRQSQEAFRSVRDRLGVLAMQADMLEGESALRVEFANGSRIVALPGNPATVRGYAADLVILDEAAFIEDDLFNAVVPMTATTGGRLFLLSTPNGQSGVFWTIWTDANGSDWHRTRVLATEVARIPTAFLELQRRQLSARQYRQEFECSFEANADTIFDVATLQASLVDGVPLFARTNGHVKEATYAG